MRDGRECGVQSDAGFRQNRPIQFTPTALRLSFIHGTTPVELTWAVGTSS